MVSKKSISICIIVSFLLVFVNIATANAQSSIEQIINNIDNILQANPLPPGQKGQQIKVAESETATILVGRSIEGSISAKPHIHKTHDETLYIVRGTAQLFIDGKWVDFNAGGIHFNPMGKAHAVRHVGKEPMVVISIFSPAMKEPDRHFVE